jgi:hypothetical protein
MGLSSPPLKLMQDIINRFHDLGFMVDGVMNITLDKLIEGTIDLSYFVRNKGAANVYLGRYNSRVLSNQWLPIELLTKEEKVYYWQESKKYTQDKEQAIKLCKVIYCIEKMIVFKYDTTGTTEES